MQVIIANEARFLRAADGSVWTNGSGTYPFWHRYHDVFDIVAVLARLRSVNTIPDGFGRADGSGVSFVGVPHYQGPVQYVLNRRPIGQAIRRAMIPPNAVILRAPGAVASVAHATLQRDRPFGVEVVGDPYDVFAPGAIRHPLRPFFRGQFARDLGSVVRCASAVAYVTDSVLQARYSPSPNAFTTSYSSIDLSPDGYVPHPRSYTLGLSSARLLFVGSLEQMYKAPDVVIRAVAQLLSRGCDVTLRIAGDGRHRDELETLAKKLEVSRQIRFLGHLAAGAAVREQLDETDVFVLPSRTEGLPRAMIEAMARGLPVVGSTAGGIPELLHPEDMVPPGNVDALTSKLLEVITSPTRMTEMSRRNLVHAERYRSDVLRARRIEFYRTLRNQTESWLIRQNID